jgi:hypothetical protein
LNFNYFIDEQEFQYLLRAIELVSEHGWRLLPFYHFDDSCGVWKYQGQSESLPSSLSELNFADYCHDNVESAPARLSLDGVCDAAETELRREGRSGDKTSLLLSSEGERLRWFVLPQDVACDLD